jgi:hypothetical protein
MNGEQPRLGVQRLEYIVDLDRHELGSPQPCVVRYGEGSLHESEVYVR